LERLSKSERFLGSLGSGSVYHQRQGRRFSETAADALTFSTEEKRQFQARKSWRFNCFEQVTPNKSEGAGQDSTPAIVARLQALLGHDVLLLHWPLGSKGTKKRWKHLTLDIMSDPVYLAELASGNIGVAQGEISNGLCSIDVDIDAEIDGFLNLNPKLRTTLRTKGERGCNVWFRIVGESCPTAKIKTNDGRSWGEFRGTGSQTIIYGKHPSGCNYSMVVEAPPLQIDISEIVWPEHVIDPFSKQNHPLNNNHSTEFCTSEFCAPMSCVSVPLCDIGKANEVLTNIEGVRRRREALKELFPGLTELYETFIKPKFKAAAEHRNGFIVEAAPFVYRVVCAPLALQLLQFFYEMYRPLFKDTPEQHCYEAQKMLESVAATYRHTLNEIDRKIYDALPDVEQDAFRILRDLALWPQPKGEPFQFFMSCKQLGDRLQIDRRVAYRILLRFEDEYRLIKCTAKGKMWVPGEKPQASVYRWLLN
jgi:hypothetical protein